MPRHSTATRPTCQLSSLTAAVHAAVIFSVSVVCTSLQNSRPYRHSLGPTPLHHPHRHQSGAPSAVIDAWPPGAPSGSGNADARNADLARRLDHLRIKILNLTGMEDGPLNVSSRNRSGVESASFPAVADVHSGAWKAKSEPGYGFDERQTPNVIHEIKEFADEVPGLSDVTGVIQFVLHPKETPGMEASSQRVIQATMRVFVRLRPPSQGPKTARLNSTRRRITIVVFLLGDLNDEATATYRMNGESSATYRMNGDKVTATYRMSSNETKATYRMNGDEPVATYRMSGDKATAAYRMNGGSTATYRTNDEAKAAYRMNGESSATYRMNGESARLRPPGERPAPPMPIAQLTILVRRTKWHRILLPTTIVQRVFDSPDRVLCLKIDCVECHDDIQVVTAPRRGPGGGRGRTRKARMAGRLGRGGSKIGGKSEWDDDDGDGRASGKTDRKSRRSRPPPGDGKLKPSPVLIVRTKSITRPRKPL